jgi:hypothetical protein
VDQKSQVSEDTQMSISPQMNETEAAASMTRHGIIRAYAVQYRYKDWRYSNLADAIAQAERDASRL